MERAHRTPVATFLLPGSWAPSVELGAEAAHHAMVKRLAAGDVVRLTSGDGRRALGRIALLERRAMQVEVDVAGVEEGERPPYVELVVPIGDRDRMLWLAEKATELGVSAWRTVRYRRSRSVSPRGEGGAFAEKVRARMRSALEQSGGAWLPDMLGEHDLGQLAVGTSVRATTCLLLDARGAPLREILAEMVAPVAIAIGPEGGVEDGERRILVQQGWRPASLGANVLRFETAGLAALAAVRVALG